MRPISREPQEYILPSEWERYKAVLRGDKKLLPARWFIRVLSGGEMFRWTEIRTAEMGRVTEETVEAKAARALELDTDILVSAVSRVEDYEDPTTPEDAPKYTILTEPRDVRKAINELDMLDRNELTYAVRSRATLNLGEPARLRQRLMSFSGAEQGQAASANTTATSAPAPDGTSAGTA